MLAEEYQRPEPLLPKKNWERWFSVAKKGVGFWAFALHRLTGILLVLYLFLHFYVLSSLVQGADAYEKTVKFMESPILTLLEVGLVAVILYHGLNGLRLMLMALNVGVKQHKAMFWAVMVMTVLLTLIAALLMF